jgi:uncharacterized RDD family membrane protein YckC
MTSLPAGWYKDPADPSTQRWWDGEGWLGKAIPADATPPDGPPPAEEEEPAAPVSPVSGEPATGGPGTGGPGAGEPAAAETLPGGQHPAEPPATPTAADPALPAPPPGGWVQPAPEAGPPPPGWGPPPPGWAPPPPGWQPPAGHQQPPSGWQAPPGWQPPPGWTPPPPGWGLHAYGYQIQARPHGLALAGLGRRLVARLIDIAAVLLLNVLVNGWLAYQWWLEVEPIFRAAMADPFASPEPASARSSYLILTMLLIATALWFAYEVPALANSGQTLGKRLARVKVMRLENTDQLGFARAFRRWFRLGMWTPLWGCCYIGFLAQLFYAGSVLFDRKLHQALYDKSAATVVVTVPPGQSGQPVTAPSEPVDDPTGGER